MSLHDEIKGDFFPLFFPFRPSGINKSISGENLVLVVAEKRFFPKKSVFKSLFLYFFSPECLTPKRTGTNKRRPLGFQSDLSHI